jgi:OPT family oligopeptide transporter
MGPSTTFHMLFGAIVGWGVLSPIAKIKGWAPGPIDDWEEGSKGWVMWVSLAIMLADSVISVGWLVLRPMIKFVHQWVQSLTEHLHHGGTWHDFLSHQKIYQHYKALKRSGSTSTNLPATTAAPLDHLQRDVPPQQLVSNTAISILLPLTLVFCVLCVHFSFGSYIAPTMSTLATLLAVIAAAMGIRALGETDLNPTSGIGKIAQLMFAVVTGKDNPNAIVINLLAGSISESGAGQAGDLMQDFKTAHLLNASPKVQFYGQIIGSIFGVVVSPAVYRLYVSVYELPSQLFQMPSAYIWIFTARLVTGKDLPPMAWQFGICAGFIFIFATTIRIYLKSHSSAEIRALQKYVPGGIAVAVGMYTTPYFSIPRAVGGLLNWWYMQYHQEETTIIVIASGLILGEGIVSMVNLGLASLGVPHL